MEVASVSGSRDRDRLGLATLTRTRSMLLQAASANFGRQRLRLLLRRHRQSLGIRRCDGQTFACSRRRLTAPQRDCTSQFSRKTVT